MTLRDRVLTIAEGLLSQPTAPFREHRVREHIKAFCKERGLQVRQDAMGNVIATTAGPRGGEVLGFEAHMDHPGFIIEKDSRRGRTTALFYGGVDNEYFAGAKVRVFGEAGEARGRVTKVQTLKKQRCRRAWLELEGDARRGDLAMWDLAPCRVRGDRLTSRACDDVVGCVAILGLIDELARRGIERRVRCIFTVAEEGGLHGARYLCAKGSIPKRTRIVAIETSRELPQAHIGDGAVIRVGDRGTIFSPAMTAFMVDVARRVGKRRKGFRWQRKLMDGGTCESSVYAAHGYVAGAACVPLGNYHNRNFRTKRIAAETVSVNDLVSLVELFVGMVEQADRLGDFLRPAAPTYTEERRPLGEWLLSR